ncbi:unnamed protein product [Penicillium bialowiezense]
MAQRSCGSNNEQAEVSEIGLWSNGITFHSLCIVICAFSTLTAILLAGLLIIGHATHYSKPTEQQ